MNQSLKHLLLHKPIPLDRTDSYESLHMNDEVIQRSVIKPTSYQFEGRGTYLSTPEKLQLSIHNTYDTWMPEDPQDGDYVNYGRGTLTMNFDRENWESFHRIYLNVAYEGLAYINPHIIVSFVNEGAISVPDVYNREGYHGINLESDSQTYFVDISDLPRDAITKMCFTIMAGGTDRSAMDSQTYTITQLKKVAMNDRTSNRGWEPKVDIIYSHNGYHPQYEKKAIVIYEKNLRFNLVNKLGETVYTNTVYEDEFGNGILDFTHYTETGMFILEYNNHSTEPFLIDSHKVRWIESVQKALNFVYCQRCGTIVSDVHCSCHEDVIANYRETMISFNGGWHDAGDLSQQLIQSMELTASLLEMACALDEKDELLYYRLIEECEWGIDFIFKTRFDQGYRATSAGVTRWTNNRIGDSDDAQARVHKCAYENYLCASIEAYLAQNLPAESRLRFRLEKIAQEDFAYAEQSFEEQPYQTTEIFWEHTYNTSKSLYDATITLAATNLYHLTQDLNYKKRALDSFAKMRACQHIDETIVDGNQIVRGFFYRENNHKVVNHFNHQAREHLYAEAFLAALSLDPTNEDYVRGARMYGSYLKYLSKASNSYGMVASGVYHVDEYKDLESFNVQHLLVGEEASRAYLEQLQMGRKINECWYLKAFPVWFSFRGNNGILLSTAKSAVILGNYFKDDSLLMTAENQLQWIVGKNPFGQSMMYGEGKNYAQQYSVQSGEMMGEIPVGVQTFENEDAPYWSQLNNATYKEVWTGLAGRWMSIVAELIK